VPVVHCLAASLRRMFLNSHSTLKYSTLLWTPTTARAGQAGPHNRARQGRPDLLAAVLRAVGGERAGRGVHALRDRRAQVRRAAARVPRAPGRQPLAALVDHPRRLRPAGQPPLQQPAGTPVQVEAQLGSRLPHQSLQATRATLSQLLSKLAWAHCEDGRRQARHKVQRRAAGAYYDEVVYLLFRLLLHALALAYYGTLGELLSDDTMSLLEQACWSRLGPL